MAERIRMPALDLDDQSWAVLADAVREFEQSWHSDAATDIGQFLPTAANPLRERVLVELVKVDQEYRWEQGEQRRVEDYLADWPDLGGRDAILAELLEAECLTRAVLDSAATVDELRIRFPAIHERVNLHQISADAEVERGGPPATNILALPLDTSNRSLENTASRAVDKYVLKPGHCFGRYEILGLLGRGGMGTVYRARDTHLKREVALKIPRFDARSDPDAVARFVREAEAAAQIDHPNVCTIYDAGEIDGTYYITMRLVHGPSLASWIKNGQLDLRQAASIVGKLATALAGVHDKGIVHRDIKPSNVMMDESDEPLLMDFGLARPSDVDRLLTSSGAVLGTLPYMSPQQVDGEPADFRSDIYSLGVLLYQMLTGRLPFTGKLTEVMVRISKSRPPKPSKFRVELDPELEAICLKAMVKSPADRYQSVAEMADALQQYLEGLPRPHGPLSRVRRQRLGAAGAGALVLLGVLIYLKTGSGTLELDVPADATVKIDGHAIEIKSTGGIVTVTVGEHDLRVSRAGKSASESFTIRWRGETVRRSVTLPGRSEAMAASTYRQPYGATEHSEAPEAPAVVFPPNEEDVVLLAGVERWIEVPGGSHEGICPGVDGTKLIVPLYGNNAHPLTVVDGDSGQQIQPIMFSVTSVPPHLPQHEHKGTAVSADGRYLYLTNYYDDRIYRIDLQNDSAVCDVAIGGRPDAVWAVGMAITPDQKKLVVTMGHDGRSEDLNNDQISIVDIENGRFQLLAEVPLDDEPAAPNLAFSSDGQHAYVVTQKRKSAAPTLYEVRLKLPCGVTRKLAFPDGNLRGVAVSSACERVFVSDAVHRRIWSADLKTFQVASEIELYGHAPGALAISEDGMLLVVLCPETRKLFCLNAVDGMKVGGASGLEQAPWDVKFLGDERSVIVSHGGAQDRIAFFSTSRLLDRVVFASNRAGGSHQLYIAALDGKKLVQLTDDHAENRFPFWSPDGREIAFVSDRAGPNRVCVIGCSDWHLRVLEKTDPVQDHTVEASLDWRSDGSQVAFIRNNHHSIRAVNVKTGEIRTIFQGKVGRECDHYSGLCGSRADDRIFFTSQSAASSFDKDIFRLDPDTGQVTQVTDEWGRRPYFLSPAASPDRARLVAVREPGPNGQSRHLVLLPSDGAEQRSVLHTRGDSPANPRWFPDGAAILYSAGHLGHRHIFWSRTDGLQSGQLTDGDWDDIDPDIASSLPRIAEQTE